MAIEEEVSSWALTVFDTLESPTHARKRMLVAAGALLVTIGMWTVHLLNPDILGYLIEVDDMSKLVLGFLLAPPFVTAFAIGTFIYPQPIEPKRGTETGPMSTYFYQERSSKRWKLLIAAGLVAAVNFLLMLVTAATA